MKPIRNILWPTDLSPLSLASAYVSRDLTRRFGSTLHVLHVAPILVPDSTIAIETAGDLLASGIDTCGPPIQDLDRLVAAHFGADSNIVRKVRVGTPWYEICDYARSAAIDIIVISTHGLSGVKHALLGSVAERVVQHATCPVFVVKCVENATIK